MARIRIGKQTELSTIGGAVVLTDITTREQKYLAQGTTGQVLTESTVTGPTWVTPTATGLETRDDFSPVAATTTTTLTATPLAGKLFEVYRNGLLQIPTTDYSIAGLVITYVVAFGVSSGASGTETVSVIYEV